LSAWRPRHALVEPDEPAMPATRSGGGRTRTLRPCRRGDERRSVRSVHGPPADIEQAMPYCPQRRPSVSRQFRSRRRARRRTCHLARGLSSPPSAGAEHRFRARCCPSRRRRARSSIRAVMFVAAFVAG
jgi:hypothetical protein